MLEQAWGGAREGKNKLEAIGWGIWGSETMGKWWEAPIRYKEVNKYVRREGG